MSLPPEPRGVAALVCCGSELLIFGGSSQWSEIGATSFHNDMVRISLAAALETIDIIVASPMEENEKEIAAVAAAAKLKECATTVEQAPAAAAVEVGADIGEDESIVATSAKANVNGKLANVYTATDKAEGQEGVAKVDGSPDQKRQRSHI